MSSYREPEGAVVLVVDDDELLRVLSRGALEEAGCQVLDADCGKAALELFEAHRPEAVLLDLNMPGMDGFEVCRQIRRSSHGRFLPVLVMTAADDLESIERAYEEGATDFEIKPINWNILRRRLGYMLRASRVAAAEARRREMERNQLRTEVRQLRRAVRQSKLVYASAEMETLLATAGKVAGTDATVLIAGESGTGKELVARAVHELSPRRDKPWVVVDCGAIPSNLMESELFGHERGAFTGAEQRRKGRLAEAEGGTLLLDEIGELPLEVQTRLLRFVQDKQFVAVGSSRVQTVDVRILAATNRDLTAEVAARRFREDLFYRLNVVQLEVPPLRERTTDIAYLARHFVEKFRVQYQRDVHLATGIEQELVSYPWPGNVRELENRILQAVILTDSDRIGASDLQLPASGPPGHASTPSDASARQSPHPDQDSSRLPISAFTDPATQAPPLERAAQPEHVELLEALRSALATEAERALGRAYPPPVGQWLAADLLESAAAATSDVFRHGASLVGLAETTFRRRLLKVRRQVPAERSETWDEIQELLDDLVRTESAESLDLASLVPQLLLEEVMARAPSVAIGAALVGVSPPTYRHRARHPMQLVSDSLKTGGKASESIH